jgi:hypothetical protein
MKILFGKRLPAHSVLGAGPKDSVSKGRFIIPLRYLRDQRELFPSKVGNLPKRGESRISQG